MGTITRYRSLTALLDAQRQETGERYGAPESLVGYAAEVTARTFSGRTYSQEVERRAARYFDAVVRRRLVTLHGTTEGAARLVIDSVIADLSDSGRDGKAIWAEIERGWTASLAPVVREEYRRQLCA